MPKRYLLAWIDRGERIERRTIAPIRRQMEDAISESREDAEIDIWLDSGGGDAHAAYKLALMARSAAAKVRVVIPDFAKSAATLLAVSGDEIYLAPGADMGPLDAQMHDEGSLEGQISALNIARAADEVARDAVSMAVNGGVEVLERTGLSRAETLEAMLAFSAGFSEPLVSQLDPKVVHHAKQLLKVTAKYAERLLHDVGCEDPAEVARALVMDFPTHGYVISIDQARDLGLPVQEIADYEHVDLVKKLLRGAEEGVSIKTFVRLEEALPPPPKKTAKPKAKAKKRKRKTGGGRNGQPEARSSSRGGSNGSRAGAASAA
jgi:ATP-dependent protease ClpP protease subunit